MIEEWRDIIADKEDYTSFYQVSNIGRVRSLDRVVTYKNGRKRFFKGRILKQGLNHDGKGKGYWAIQLHRGGKAYRFFVHRLMAIMFIPNLENKPCINHKDLHRENNDLNNLEWCTHSENSRHARDNGRCKVTKKTRDKLRIVNQGENNPSSKLTNEKVLLIRKEHQEGKTIKELAIQFGVGEGHIYAIIKRKGWSHLP